MAPSVESRHIYLFIIYLLHGLYHTLTHSQSEESQVRDRHISIKSYLY